MILSRMLFGVDIEIERTAKTEKINLNQCGETMRTDFGNVIDNCVEITSWI